VRSRGTLCPALAAAPPTTIASLALRPTPTAVAAAPSPGAEAKLLFSYFSFFLIFRILVSLYTW